MTLRKETKGANDMNELKKLDTGKGVCGIKKIGRFYFEILTVGGKLGASLHFGNSKNIQRHVKYFSGLGYKIVNV